MKNSTENKVLIIDDEINMLHMLSAALRKEGYEIVTTNDAAEGLSFATQTEFNIILCDLKMPKMDGLEFLLEMSRANVSAPVIMMSAFATVDTAVQAMKIGAYDFITKPFKIDEILLILQKASERERLKKDNKRLQLRIGQLERDRSFRSIIGESKEIKDVVQLALKSAKHDTTILITGESGTGKELFARGIQLASQRKEKPFLSVNCGAIPRELLESEFFGYEKGAFTGADQKKNGIFEDANGGTLFLDEIGELPIELQVKLLRVLQEQEIRPLGASSSKKINVRIIGATAKNLEEEVEKGTFRKDLYYRLNIIVLTLPPLRNRQEDITELAKHFVRKYSKKAGLPPPKLSKDTLQALYRYNWPGNVRELENCMERAVVLCEKDLILPTDLPFNSIDSKGRNSDAEMFQTTSLKRGKEEMEIYLIKRALQETAGNKSQAAKLLEVSYPSLLNKLKDYQIIDK